MNKVSIGLLVGFMVASSALTASAALSWSYGGNLTTWDATVSSGMFVQMYEDVNNDTTVGGITSFTTLGAPEGGSSSDDTLLASFTTLTAEAKGQVAWATDIASWSTLYGDDVYSVLYKAGDIGSASSAVVVDSAPATMGSADPDTYSIATVGNSWVPVGVPEPATFAFMGIGALAFFLCKKIKA